MSAGFDVMAAIAEAVAVGPDMNEAQAGGTFELPAAGLTRLRFIKYIELGKHEKTIKGDTKTNDTVWLEFELSGPKHSKPADEKPYTIGFSVTLSLNEKATFYKLFKRMNHDGKAKHMAQLLGQDFLGTVVHNETGEGENKKTYANLRDGDGYTIRPPFVEDPETGESRRVPAEPARTALAFFAWATATKPMWDSIFIDGKWDDKVNDKGEVTREGTSKNYFQNLIKSAKNFKGSPVSDLVFGEVDIPGAEKTERSESNVQASVEKKAGAEVDPLEGAM